MSKRDQYQLVRSVINTGSELAGAAVGGVVGALFPVGGPIVAAGAGAAGFVVSKVLEKGITEVANRMLSHRETVRVGAVTAFAFSEIQSQLDAGKALRSDDFFDNSSTRDAAAEVFEGVLLKAKNEHQEKKVRLLGLMFAEVSFDPSVSVGEANHLLAIVERLTYRQLCIMAMLTNQAQSQKQLLRETNYHENDSLISFETISVLQEVFDLNTLGFVAQKLESEGEDYLALLAFNDIVPSQLQLTRLGTRFSRLLALQTISQEDIEIVSDSLR
jgi:hypothetical protein